MGYPAISLRRFLPTKAGRKVHCLVFVLALSTFVSGILVILHDSSGDGNLAGGPIGTLAMDQSAALPVPPPLFRPVFLFFLVAASRYTVVFLLDICKHDGRPPPAIIPA
jgi:hypothetical protein